jgi:hypothetical protein
LVPQLLERAPVGQVSFLESGNRLDQLRVVQNGTECQRLVARGFSTQADGTGNGELCSAGSECVLLSSVRDGSGEGDFGESAGD